MTATKSSLKGPNITLLIWLAIYCSIWLICEISGEIPWGSEKEEEDTSSCRQKVCVWMGHRRGYCCGL